MKTAVLRTGAIGDLIVTASALKKYSEIFTGEEITVFCGRSCIDAVKNLPYTVNTFDDGRLYHGGISGMVSTAFGLIRSLRGFDKVFVLHSDLRWCMLPFLAGCGQISTMRGLSGSGRIYQCLGIAPSAEHYFIPDSKPSIPEKPYTAIAPGGGRNIHRDDQCRRWAGFKELIRMISAEHNVVLLGSESDSPEMTGVLDMCGKTSLSDAYHIIDGAELFIGNDSGLLHLAACTDTPAIGIYTATTPDLMPDNVTAVRSGLPCSPCEKNGRFSTSCKCECTSSISTEDVMKVINGLILSGESA